MAKKPLDDAWKQHHDLLEKYTQEWTPRVDLKVWAHATDRAVEIEVGERRVPEPEGLTKLTKWIWHGSGQRNVGTMRELAHAILEACDFVDESNPVWAEGHA